MIRQTWVCGYDLAPCDFWIFPKLKTTLKGMRFQLPKDIIEKTVIELRNIPEKEFKKRFQMWQSCWEKCVLLQEEYFEGD